MQTNPDTPPGKIIARAAAGAALAVIVIIIQFGISTSATCAQTNQAILKLDPDTSRLLTSSLQDTWFKKEALGSTILGAALAIAGGFAATFLADFLQARHKKSEEAEFCDNLLRAIRCEVEALYETYKTGIGNHLIETKEGQFFAWRLALTEDWFTVYRSNAANLGRLEAAVAIQIITVYILVKRLIEQYRINNGYLDELDKVSEQPQNVIGRESHYKKLLIAHIATIRLAEKQLIEAREKLIQMLDERGIR